MPKQRQFSIYWFWVMISMYTILGVYLLYIAYSTPLIGVQLKPLHHQWYVTHVDFTNWENNIRIINGDIIISVDGVPTNDVKSVQQHHTIFAANELVIQHKNDSISKVTLHITDHTKQFLCYFYHSNHTLYINIDTRYLFISLQKQYAVIKLTYFISTNLFFSVY